MGIYDALNAVELASLMDKAIANPDVWKQGGFAFDRARESFTAFTMSNIGGFTKLIRAAGKSRSADSCSYASLYILQHDIRNFRSDSERSRALNCINEAEV